jgi:membrane dipeptidase
MINFSPDFVSCVPNTTDTSSHLPVSISLANSTVLLPAPSMPVFYDKNSTLQHVARHIIHIGSQIGYDHVGLGSDFDGIFSTPKGLEDVSKFPDLVAELLRLGISDDDAKKIVGGNVLRAWREVEETSARLKRQGTLPAEDRVHMEL